jgi:hypothetical protein
MQVAVAEELLIKEADQAELAVAVAAVYFLEVVVMLELSILAVAVEAEVLEVVLAVAV